MTGFGKEPEQPDMKPNPEWNRVECPEQHWVPKLVTVPVHFAVSVPVKIQWEQQIFLYENKIFLIQIMKEFYFQLNFFKY